MKPLLVCIVTLAAGADTAAADDLPASRSSLVQTAPFVRYDRIDPDTQGARVGFSGRALIGAHLGYAVGLDLEAGATGEGAVFNAELFPVGLGLRFGGAGVLTVAAGVGAGGAGGGVQPIALQIPIEVRGRAQIGPVRLMAWTIARETPLTDDRDLELEGTVAVGWGRQLTYWTGSSAGSGPFVAVTAHRVDEETALSVTIGLEIVGAN